MGGGGGLWCMWLLWWFRRPFNGPSRDGGLKPKTQNRAAGLGFGSAVGNGSGAQWGDVVGCGVCGGCGGLGGHSMVQGRVGSWE
jgi:hypothetical protein